MVRICYGINGDIVFPIVPILLADIWYHFNYRSVFLTMPRYDKYFVVEFRLPIRIDEVTSVQEAVSLANRICERQHGFKPDNWFARVFQYSTEDANTGPFKEYFYNPHSATYREVAKNHGYHNDLVKNGVNPIDGFNYEKLEQELEVDLIDED